MMTAHDPYLIQRCRIRHPLVEGRFSEAVETEYMGSSEFEFGTMPKSLRALQAGVDNIKLTVEPSITTGENNDRRLRVLHMFNDAEYATYLEQLVLMRADKLRLKESSHFTAKRADWHRADLWWDLENHVMFSFDKVFMKRLPDVLVASWKYMDEMKAKK